MKENGYFVICDPGTDKPILEGASIMCRHCGGHWLVRPGSGRERGWCGRCNGPVCSVKCLQRCVPRMAQIENMEAGRLADAELPVSISVPSSFQLVG